MRVDRQRWRAACGAGAGGALLAGAAALTAVTAGCGSTVAQAPGDPMPIGVSGGSRLRPRVSTGDGVASFIEWYDTELQVTCTFGHAADGRMRCMPTRWTVLFLDGACTRPALLTWCGRAGDYGALRDQTPPEDWCAPRDPADPPSLMYRRAGAAVGQTTAYPATFANGKITCQSDPVSLEPSDVLVPAELVPLDSFVAAEERLEQGPGRLARRVRVAEDGARELLGAYDTALDEPCRRLWRTASDACAPQSASPPWGFADPACTEPAVAAQCETPAVVIEKLDACTDRLRSVGAEVAEHYLDSEGSCALDTTLGPDSRVYRVGPALADGALPAVVEHWDGNGRLKAYRLSDAFGMLLRPVGSSFGELYDSELGMWCLPYQLTSGDERCWPLISVSANSQLQLYADPACTEPVLVVSADTCADWLPKVYSRAEVGAECPTVSYLDTRAVLGPVEQVFDHSGASCVAASLQVDQRALALGPPLNPASFAPATVEIW